MPGATNPITVGNLIMFHNQNGTALEYVTSVAGQTIGFSAGDPAGLNQSGKTFGTVANLATSPGVFPPTTVTRVWMVTYYVDATNPQDPQLIRQVNYPGYPGGNPVNPPRQLPMISRTWPSATPLRARPTRRARTGSRHSPMVLATPPRRFYRTRRRKSARSMCSWQAGLKRPTQHCPRRNI